MRTTREDGHTTWHRFLWIDVEMWGEAIPRVRAVHRAMADVEQSLAYARAFRAAAFGGGA